MTSLSDARPPPSSLALAVSSLLLGLVAGYFIGTGSSIGLFSSSSSSNRSKRKVPFARQKKSWPNSYDVTIHPDSSADEAADDEDSDAVSEDEDLGDGQEAEIGDFGDTREEVKLMLVVRTDLGMTKGKIAAQCGHATLAVYKALIPPASPSGERLRRKWENHGQPKIAVQCKSEDDLLMLQAQAISLGVVARVIRDAGRTQIASGSVTVLGLLGPKSVVDQVTGGLKLL
jgi:peptidyl-tRNA hydrolase, PTH2 family